MTEEPVADVDALAAWSAIAARVEHGESVPFIAHGKQVGYIVPVGELERLQETIAVLSDPDTIADLRDHTSEDQLSGVEALHDLLAARQAAGKR
ncbi:hypothetical protein ONR57_08980 [Hoyosella sp. YIM 151337]|uniref:hypothetical protein n=1 Tax=Hoyosella sp. YIM 151337 TaxID=2992742 RepID=UPI002236B907|nr:hypothetical protein [Hoyosella sp. YIM 151337]MCW4353429.1 hypothetical protein [Hoyosella sp. YIM 151337]